MTGNRSSGGRLAAAVPLLAVWLAWACRPSSGPLPASGVGVLADGPTRWLMLPEEEKEMRRLRSTQEMVAFIEAFWRRRDPDPTTPGNDFSRTFYERVEAADNLYSEDGRRGSLTDRGHALVLLGPPPVLRYSQKRVPAWEPGQPNDRPALDTRNLVVESWVYRPADLPPGVLDLLDEAPEEILLMFVVGERKTYQIEGGKILELAARAAVRGRV